MLKEFGADLHIHTCLSPCADDEMIPVNILNMAKLLGTKIIGICDHNSAKNVQAIIDLASGYDILVVPGMEVQSVEEVHLLCFFEKMQTLLKWQEYVYGSLPSIKNRPEYFGHQWIVDGQGNILDEECRMLLASTSFTVEDISKMVAELGGLLIPAHVDRGSYSIISQLGFIPESLRIDGIEFSRMISKNDFITKFPGLERYTLITSYDAHRLKDMVYQKTFFHIESLNYAEVVMALKGLEGRKVVVT